MIDVSTLLANIPNWLRQELLEEYKGIATAFTEGRWKLAGIDAGRFCEATYSILEGALSGCFPAAASKPTRFPDACKALENKPPIPIGDHSLRILIPRILPGIYDIRNNRNVGHVSGDIKPNKMDATYVYSAATWVIAELVRVFHATTVADAQESIDALVERTHPMVWECDGIKRVLAPQMTASERTLILLYSTPAWQNIPQLQRSIKGNKNYRHQILAPLAQKMFIEIGSGDRAMLTPLGVRHVEKTLLPKANNAD